MACQNYYLRTGDREYHQKAVAALEEAIEHDNRFVLAYHNLSRIYVPEGDSLNLDSAWKRVDEYHELVAKFAPSWIDGKLARLRQCSDTIRRCRDAGRTETKLEELTAQIERLGTELTSLQESKQSEEQRLPQLEQRRPVPIRISAWQEQRAGGRGADPAIGGRFGTEAGYQPRTEEVDRLGGRPPGIAGEDFRRRITSLLARKQNAKKEKDLLQELLKTAENAAKEATKSLAQIVPHDWLYVNSSGRRELRADVLQDHGLRSEGRWEDELNDLHVEALIQFAAVLAQDRNPGRIDPLGLLELVRDSFYPRHFDALNLALAITEGDRHSEWDRHLLQVLEEELQAEPGHFAALTWVVPGPLSAEDRSRRERVRLLKNGADAAVSQQNTELLFYVAGELKKFAMATADAEYIARERKKFATTTAVSETAAQDSLTAREIWEIVLDALRKARIFEQAREPRIHDADWYRREIGTAHWALEKFDEALNEFEAMGLGLEQRAPGLLEEMVTELMKRSPLPETRQRLQEWLMRRRRAALRSTELYGAATQKAISVLRRRTAPRPQLVSSDLWPELWVHPAAIGTEPEPEDRDPEDQEAREDPEAEAREDRFRATLEQTYLGLRRQFCFLDDTLVWRTDVPIPARGYGLILGAWLLSGSIIPSWEKGYPPFFCPYPSALDDHFRKLVETLFFTFNPASDIDDGLWITDRDLIDKLVRRGYELWDPDHYICQHVRSTLVRHLPELVRYETIVRLLDKLGASSSESLATAVRSLRSNSETARRSLAQFIGLIKTLARDRIPIPDLAVPLRIFTERSQRGWSVAAIAEEIRLEARAGTSGDGLAARRIRLSEASLADLASHFDRPESHADGAPLALPRNLASRLVHELEQQMRAAAGRSATLVVPHELRPHLARLAENHFTQLTVLSDRGVGRAEAEAAMQAAAG